MKNGPDLWLAVIAQAKTHYAFSHAFVAGGAVRDFMSGWEPRDVDCFVWNGLTDCSNPSPARDKYGNDIKRPVFDVKNDYTDPALRRQFIVLHQKEPPTLEALLGTFDLGICRIGFDGYSFLATSDYLQDAGRRTITLCHDRTLERTRERAKDFQRRHPSWKIIDPYPRPRKGRSL